MADRLKMIGFGPEAQGISAAKGTKRALDISREMASIKRSRSRASQPPST